MESPHPPLREGIVEKHLVLSRSPSPIHCARTVPVACGPPFCEVEEATSPGVKV